MQLPVCQRLKWFNWRLNKVQTVTWLHCAAEHTAEQVLPAYLMVPAFCSQRLSMLIHWHRKETQTGGEHAFLVKKKHTYSRQAGNWLIAADATSSCSLLATYAVHGLHSAPELFNLLTSFLHVFLHSLVARPRQWPVTWSKIHSHC